MADQSIGDQEEKMGLDQTQMVPGMMREGWVKHSRAGGRKGMMLRKSEKLVGNEVNCKGENKFSCL